MAWDFSPQWGCLNYMAPDYLNNPHSLVNHYSKMMGSSVRGPRSPMFDLNQQQHAFRRPRTMGMMRGGPRMNRPAMLHPGEDNMAWHNIWRPTRMYPQSWVGNNQQQRPMLRNNYFAQDVPVSWHANNLEHQERGLYPPQECDLSEYTDDTYQDFETETSHYPDAEAALYHEPEAPYLEAEAQYHETEAFQCSEPETFQHHEPEHFQSGQSQPSPWFPDFPQQPQRVPGPVRRRNRKKKVRDDIPYQRTQPTSASVYKVQVQLKQLGDNLQSLSVEWKEGTQVPTLSTLSIAVYDVDALTNILWLDKPGSYVFTLFGKTGIKMEAYGLNTLANKKDARYVSASGRCDLKVSTDNDKHETIVLARRTCDRNLLDALVMEDCFTMTQEHITKSFYEIRVVKSEDFIMVEDGLLFDTSLSNQSSRHTPASENSKKRKLSVETTNNTVTSVSNPVSSVGLPSAGMVSGASSDSTKAEAVPRHSAGACADTSVENPHDISSFLILDATLNQSGLEGYKSDLTGDLGSDGEDAGNENEPPNKKAKGANKTKSIFSQLKMKAEELMNSITSKSPYPNTDDRRKLKAKKENFQTTSDPTKSTAVAFKRAVGDPFKNTTVLSPVKGNSVSSSASPVIKCSEADVPTKSSESRPTSFNTSVVAEKLSPSCAASELLLTSPATNKTHYPHGSTEKKSDVSTINLPSDKPMNQNSSDAVVNRSLTSIDDLEGKEMLLLLRFMRSGKVYFIRGFIKNWLISIPFSLVASEKYEARMFELESLVSSSQPYYSIRRVSNYLTFTTQMTLDQIAELQGMAEAFIFSNHSKYHHLNHFYRNKPDAYFDDIFNNHNGVMKPYMKDFNGDQGSPINGKLKGLFFSASVNYSNGKIPPTSCFGEKRLYVPGDLLFSKDMVLYFTDFYCTTTSGKGPHYVTLVMTKKDSEADVFCRTRLRPLNVFNNPFLYKQRQRNGWQVFTCTSMSVLHVEVLYTEEIDIKTLLEKHKHEVNFEYVEIFGRGHSSVRGIPKNRRCPICNNLNKFPISSDPQA